jgi:small conductance mechanosensitive channel
MAETKVFSNSAIREVINSDGDASSMTASASLNVPIAYEADLMEIEKILEEELPKLMDVIPGLTREPTYDGVDSLGENCLYLRISITTKLESKSAALRSLTREIKLLFDRRGVEIPYNQLVLHNAPGFAPEADTNPVDPDSRPKKDQQ